METENKSGVYWIINRANNKRYLGSSENLKNRWRDHRSRLRRGCHENSHLQRAFDKYGEEKFELEVVAYMDADKALAFEDYLLKNYPTMFEYNIARDATAPMLGREHSEETRRKIGDGNRGKTVSEETKQKIGEAHRGENGYWFGKHLTEETRKKISKAQRGDKNPKYIDIPEETIMEMKLLRNNGYSYRKIAKIFGISHPTVRNRLNNMSSATPIKQEVSREANL